MPRTIGNAILLLALLTCVSVCLYAQVEGKIEKPKSAIDAEKAHEQTKAAASVARPADKSVVPKKAMPTTAKKSALEAAEERRRLGHPTKPKINLPSSPYVGPLFPWEESSQDKSSNPFSLGEGPLLPRVGSSEGTFSGAAKVAKENHSAEGKLDLEPYDLGCGDPKLSSIQAKECREQQKKLVPH
jgi:hypothetical protein